MRNSRYCFVNHLTLTPSFLSISLNNSISRYLLLPHFVPDTCLNLAAHNINALCPSGKAPTTLDIRLIFLIILSIGLFVRILRQCDGGNPSYVSISSTHPCLETHPVKIYIRKLSFYRSASPLLYVLVHALVKLHYGSRNSPACPKAPR